MNFYRFLLMPLLSLLLSLALTSNGKAYYSEQSTAGSAFQIGEETHVIEDTSLIKNLAYNALFSVVMILPPALLSYKFATDIKLNPEQKRAILLQTATAGKVWNYAWQLFSVVTLSHLAYLSANHGYQSGRRDQGRASCDRKQGVMPVYIESPFLARLFRIQVIFDNDQQPSVYITRLPFINPEGAEVPEDQQGYAPWFKLYTTMNSEGLTEIELMPKQSDGSNFLEINGISESSRRIYQRPLPSTGHWYVNRFASWCDKLDTGTSVNSLLAPEVIDYVADLIGNNSDGQLPSVALSASQREDALLINAENYWIVHSSHNKFLYRSPGFLFIASLERSEGELLDLAVSPHAEGMAQELSAQKLWSPYVVSAIQLPFTLATYPAIKHSILSALSHLPTSQNAPGFTDISQKTTATMLAKMANAIPHNMQTKALVTQTPSSCWRGTSSFFNTIMQAIKTETVEVLYAANDMYLENFAPVLFMNTPKDKKLTFAKYKEERRRNARAQAVPKVKVMKVDDASDVDAMLARNNDALSTLNKHFRRIMNTGNYSFGVWSDMAVVISGKIEGVDDAWFLQAGLESRDSYQLLDKVLKHAESADSPAGKQKANDVIYKAIRVIAADDQDYFSEEGKALASKMLEKIDGGEHDSYKTIGLFDKKEVVKKDGLWQDSIVDFLIKDRKLLQHRMAFKAGEIAEKLSEAYYEKKIDELRDDDSFDDNDPVFLQEAPAYGWYSDQKVTLQDIIDKPEVHHLTNAEVFSIFLSKDSVEVDTELAGKVVEKLLATFRHGLLKNGIASLLVHDIGLKVTLHSPTVDTVTVDEPSTSVGASVSYSATGKSAYKVYKDYYLDLLRILPMNDVLFLANLQSSNLFPGDTKAQVQARSTSMEKASYFLGTIIEPSFHDNADQFKKLLAAMTNYGMAASSLAGRIKKQL